VHYVNIALGCFFSGTSEMVVAVGMQRFFALCVGVAYCKPQCSLRNEDLQCATVGRFCKKCDRKKQQKGWRGECSKKKL